MHSRHLYYNMARRRDSSLTDFALGLLGDENVIKDRCSHAIREHENEERRRKEAEGESYIKKVFNSNHKVS